LARAPIDPAAKLECVSYAPFRGDQTPRNPELIISPEQIAEDLRDLAKISRCVRTYSVDNGLDKVPELASRVGLKVFLGIWIGRERSKNALLIDTAVSLAKQYPGVVAAIVVGNEVLLRGDMTASDLRDVIRSVKRRVDVPVTYADVWEFWLRYREIGSDVDFVTAHFLPYWEEFPVRAEDAAAHVDNIRQRMVVAFPGKEIVIGEAGWPSQGRMRDVALPSRINQARFISELLDRARQENFRVNLFEAYDEPWKRWWEGTVGGYWGLYDGADRALKYPNETAVSNYPFWRLQMASGLLLCTSIFGTAWWTSRRRPPLPRLVQWGAVAVSATVGGILLGVGVEKMLHESYGFGGWLLQGLLLAAGIAAALLSSSALMSGLALPAFIQLLGQQQPEEQPRSYVTRMLGITLIVTILIATESALTLVFDARWRDFPFAALTMAAVPFWILTLLNRSKSGMRPLAETLFAGLLLIAAIYAMLNEGLRNWQSIWTCAAYFLLAHVLWQARYIGVAKLVPAFQSSAAKPLHVAAERRAEPADA
jgi:exo-beta-1,3-glucanase (GH17 family)